LPRFSNFTECPAAAQRGDGHWLAVGTGFLHGHLAGVEDAHEAAGIALAENRFALGDGADAEVTRRGGKVDGQQLVEQTAVHQPIANFFVQ
jgi:hypothetical protein